MRLSPLRRLHRKRGSMDADAIATLRAQAKATGGGDWIGLSDVGDWFAGTVADPSHHTVETPYGETEELLVENVTINDVPQGDQVMTFRLSNYVLKVELGTESDETPQAGWSVYVVYRGTKTSNKSGREYKAFDIAKKSPDLEAAQATAKKKASPKAAKADGDDIPF
jgi:hypothetical protein